MKLSTVEINQTSIYEEVHEIMWYFKNRKRNIMKPKQQKFTNIYRFLPHPLSTKCSAGFFMGIFFYIINQDILKAVFCCTFP